jgi:cardiolipin synthase
MPSVTWCSGNRITLLHCGAEYFPELLGAITAARSEIWLETYIFALDATGLAVRDALIDAARRGVKVRVVSDWLGTGRVNSAHLKRDFRGAGVEHRNFNPWFRRGVTRMHRKMCVVDGRVAYLGGLNIIDDMIDDRHPDVQLAAPRWDFAIRVEGPLVRPIEHEMGLQWARLGRLPLVQRLEKLARERGTRGAASNESAVAALIVRDNFRNRLTIQRAYLQALGRARHEALVVTPYFAPGRKLRRALEEAALRGVKVTLLLGVGEFPMQDAVAQSYYPKLLRAGVNIVEYRKTELHGKVAVVDDDWATVGSSNYDGLSLFVNQEANVVIKDAHFSADLRAHILSGVAEGVPVRLQEFEGRPWLQRVSHGAAFLLYRAVMRIITLGEFN